ncbi:hypothetical protein STAS_01685 [Striga asiatica]|uniref:Uncharacterized protein n=1 Tax=Striga asiatica TaxID=4170 RepID=A0A5A7P0I6_STRAF|nr:hypothetical protein STAS_01685 [Striga asiatica]
MEIWGGSIWMKDGGAENVRRKMEKGPLDSFSSQLSPRLSATLLSVSCIPGIIPLSPQKYMWAPRSNSPKISSLYSSILSCTYILPPVLFVCSRLRARSYLKFSGWSRAYRENSSWYNRLSLLATPKKSQARPPNLKVGTASMNMRRR